MYFFADFLDATFYSSGVRIYDIELSTLKTTESYLWTLVSVFFNHIATLDTASYSVSKYSCSSLFKENWF